MRPSAATFFSNVARRTKSLPTPGVVYSYPSSMVVIVPLQYRRIKKRPFFQSLILDLFSASVKVQANEKLREVLKWVCNCFSEK